MASAADNPLNFEIVSFEGSLVDRSGDDMNQIVPPSSEAVARLAESLRSGGSSDPSSDPYHDAFSTDLMYRRSAVLPRLEWAEATRRLVRLEQMNYRPIAGIIGSDWQKSARQLLRLSERGDRVYMEDPNYSLGPYCAKDGRLLPGVRVYRSRDPVPFERG